MLAASALGLIDVYNLLDQETIDAKTVVEFQKRLQAKLIMEAEGEIPGWKNTFSPRCDLHNHPLRRVMNIAVEDAPLPKVRTEGLNNCVDAWLRFGS